MSSEKARRRAVLRVFLAGPAVGLLGAIVLGIAGFPGRAGFASLLVMTAFGGMAAGLTAMIVAIIDEWRRAPVSWRRGIEALAYFAVAGLCLFALSALSAAASQS